MREYLVPPQQKLINLVVTGTCGAALRGPYVIRYMTHALGYEIRSEVELLGMTYFQGTFVVLGADGNRFIPEDHRLVPTILPLACFFEAYMKDVVAMSQYVTYQLF